jgi:monoamine oxidase
MVVDRRSFTLNLAGMGLAAALAPPGLAHAATRAIQPVRSGTLDVLVLGAGVSGLQAAWMLEQQGLKVAVLEGRNRVGGRVMTLLDEPGYPEMGFNSMGEGYGRGIDAAERAGVTLEEVGARYRVGKPPMLWLDGKPLTREEWARHPCNPFPDQWKSVLPGELVNKLVAERTPLPDWNAWLDPANAGLDVSMHQFLQAQGLSDPAIRLAHDISPYYGTNAWDVSALMLQFNDGFIKSQIAGGVKSLAVKGGNLHLPMRMAGLLKGDVLLGKEVIAIDTGSGNAVVHCGDGSTFAAKRVICSLPFSTLRSIKIMPGLSGAQAEAVAQLPYQPLSMAYLTATSPFWDEDGLAPGMWTDGLAATVIPQRFGKTPEEISGLLVQARGTIANYWDRLGRDKALAMIVAAIEAMRPAAKGKLVPRAYFSWSQEAFNGGDWAYFAPGQVSRLVPEMSKPAGLLHFCGEHTAVAARGLEGAFESAERAALEVLEA